MDREQLRNAVAKTLEHSDRPLKAKEILTVCCNRSIPTSVTVKDVNSILYSELRHVVEQDASFAWRIKKKGTAVARQHRRNDYGKERAKQHIEEARILSQLLGGTDVDVKKYFFSLPDAELKNVLDEYEKQYGASKREYAEQAFPEWRRGRKQMSGLVAERLFNLLPPRMPIATKYDMVRTIWEKYSPRSNIAFVIGPDCDPELIVKEIEQQLLSHVTRYKIPEAMENRFAWISSGDVAIRQQLLNHFLDEEKQLIATDARTRSQIILRHFEQKGQWTESAKQEYRIGNHKIELFFDIRASGIQMGHPAPDASSRYSQPTKKVAESTGCLLIAGAFLTTCFLACLSLLLFFH